MKVEAALVSPLHCTASGVGLYKAETAANARFEVETITMHGRHKSLTNIGQLSVEFFLMTADLRPRLGMDVEKHAQACIVIAYIVVAYRVMTYVNMAHVVMVCVVMACAGMVCVAMAYVAMAYVAMAYVAMSYAVVVYAVMAYVVMAYIVMAYIVMACIVMAL